MTFVKASDQAHHQGVINYRQMRAPQPIGGGVRKAMIKITEGLTWLDPKAEINAAALREVYPDEWTAYHYFRPSMDPRVQAKHFVDEAKRLLVPTSAILWADVESTDGLQRETVDARLRVFLVEVETLWGVGRVGIYTRKSFFDPYVSTNSWYARFPLWTAHYFYSYWGIPDPVALDRIPEPWIPSSWRGVGWDVHQFTAKANGPAHGTQSLSVDLSRVKVVVPPGPTVEERLSRLEAVARLHGWEV